MRHRSVEELLVKLGESDDPEKLLFEWIKTGLVNLAAFRGILAASREESPHAE